MITKSRVTEIFVLPMISAKNLMQRWLNRADHVHGRPTLCRHPNRAFSVHAYPELTLLANLNIKPLSPFLAFTHHFSRLIFAKSSLKEYQRLLACLVFQVFQVFQVFRVFQALQVFQFRECFTRKRSDMPLAKESRFLKNRMKQDKMDEIGVSKFPSNHHKSKLSS